MKKYFIGLLFIGVLFISNPALSFAQTATVDINALRAQLVVLLQKLLVLQSGASQSNSVPSTITLPSLPSLPAWTPTDNQPPTILEVTGPTSLTPATAGTWQVRAVDPDPPAGGGRLTYTIFWGDTYTPTVSNTTNSFNHTYATAGSYYLNFAVTDSGGKTSRANASVIVANRAIPNMTSTAEISVVDSATGNPVANAQVVLLSLAGQVIGTGNTHNGPVTFTNLPIGAYTAAVAAVGYTPGSKTFSIVRGGETISVSASLTAIPVAPLRVTVRDVATNLPLANTAVTVYGPNNLPFVVRQTGADGTIEFPNLTPGTTFQVGAYHLGYRLSTKVSVTIPGTGSPATLSINLESVR